MQIEAQDIEVGPISVDTGNDWLDFWFVIVLIVVSAVAYITIKRMTK